MEGISVIGLDLAKSVFQVHGIDGQGKVVVRQRLSRAKLLPFFARLPRCLIGMERPAPAPTTGRVSWSRSAMTCG